MRTNLTTSHITAREKVYNAAREGKAIYMNPEDVHALWDSILVTGRELSNLRDTLKVVSDTSREAIR